MPPTLAGEQGAANDARLRGENWYSFSCRSRGKRILSSGRATELGR
jgi:hypothetical protein